jgi:sulfonate transport system ATP-binding protein
MNDVTNGTGDLAVNLRCATKRFSIASNSSILDGIDFKIATGEFVALVGKSGSGKTTLLRILAGLESATSGDVIVPQARTVVFQEPRLIQSMKVWENVVIGIKDVQDLRALAIAALAEVGLETLAENWPAKLSGGEAQRVALARALCRRPKLLLLDEPFGALDALTRLNMQQVVRTLCSRYKPAVLLVTHDVDEALALADRVLVLSNSKIALEVQIEAERPRRMGTGKLLEFRSQLLRSLGVESD